MKSTFRSLMPLTLGFAVLFLLFGSCRTEELESIQAPTEQVLLANSTAAILMQHVASNDGSFDNILDDCSDISIEFPVTVIANGFEITINSESDLDLVEDIFDAFDDDDDIIEMLFPITIILADFTEITINNLSEFELIIDDCSDENEEDDDIECVDFQYPITASIFNANNELIETITINSDSELYEFIDDIDEDDIITIQFPITVILSDGSSVTISDLNELEDIIENFEDDCDEDDDNDYNDDDCNDCTDTELSAILTSCTNWMVDKLELNDTNLEDNYVGYLFNFTSDGTIAVSFGNDSYAGTWNASGTGNAITVNIDITGLPDFNASWILHEIEQESGETEVELRLGDDKLEFESDCENGGGTIDDTDLVAALTTGDWFITYYFDDVDETSAFSAYVFNFMTDGTASATDMSGATSGFWSTSAGDETPLELNLNFGASIPLDELSEDWDVLEVTNDIIRLKDISGGDGSIEYLTFERTLVGSGENILITALTDGTWFVGSYDEDGNDQTANFSGYNLSFDAGGTVIADNGSVMNNGTWMVLSAGNTMALDFGTDLPFGEFNDDDWDVLSVSNTQVTLQDISGGNGGIDNLILIKN